MESDLLGFTVMIFCPECRFSKIVQGQEDLLDQCPVCGSPKIEYIAFWRVMPTKEDHPEEHSKTKYPRSRPREEDFEGKPVIRLTKDGTWEIPLKELMKAGIAVIKEDDGEFSIIG